MPAKPKTPPPIVFLDCETDDLDRRRRQPWDVAIIRRDPNGTEQEYQFYVEMNLADSDPFALAMGGYYERHPYGQFLAGNGAFEPEAKSTMAPLGPIFGRGDTWTGYLTRRAAALSIVRLTHGAHVVGAIPSFDDETFANNLIHGAGLRGNWHYHLIDVEALAVGYLHGVRAAGGASDPRVPVTLPWDSEALSHMVGVTPPAKSERHTALADARWARDIYDAIMGES